MKLHLQTDSQFYHLAPLVGAAIVSGAAALASNAGNMFFQNRENRKQEAWTREQFDYNRQLNETLMQREDTAYQRAVEDARAAGLSPLTVAGTGGAGSGGSVSSSNLSMNTQAPQIEANTFQDAIRTFAEHALQERQLKAQSESQEDQQDFEMMKQSAALDAQDEMLDKQLKQASEIEDKRLKEQEMQRIQQKKIFNATQRNIYEAKNQEERIAASREAQKAAAALGVRSFDFISDWNEYKQALKARSVGAQTRASDSWAMTQGYDETTTNGGSRSVGANFGAHGSAASYGSATSDIGASASLSASESGSASSTLHSSAVQQMNQKEVEYWNKTGYPVYIGDHHHEDI